MSGTPKFSPFRAWAKPHTNKGTNGDDLRSPHGSDPQAEEDRKADLKRAAFFVAVAILFVLANHVFHVKDASEGSSGGSLASVSLTVSPPERFGDGFSVRFQLSNKGNHSIFYPLGAGKNGPVGQIVARKSPSSEWMPPSGNSKHGVYASQESIDSNAAWIEMPPGGWFEGQFLDVDQFHGEHAYAIFVKPLRSTNAVMIVSNSYALPANELRDLAKPVE